MTANGIGVEEAKAVSEMLKTNKTLSELNLGGKNGERMNTKEKRITQNDRQSNRK